MMRRRTFIAASLGTVAGAVGICVPGTIERKGDVYTGAALAFGTTISVTVAHANGLQAELAIEDAFREVQRVHRLLSVHSPDSQVARLNRDGVLHRPDPQLLAVLEQARALSVLTKGAFDITVQPLWQTFTEAAAGGSLPPQALRLQAKARVNWERVEYDEQQVRFRKPGMAITLNGLAQGYAADLALAAVRARGIEHVLLDTGEFSGRGSRDGQRPWTLGVLDPREPGQLADTIRIDGRSVATSGDYETAFTSDFVHHHIFDPATGESPQELASVTVLAPTAMLADGLSTACMVLGARKAHALAARLGGVDLMTINKRGIVWKSPHFPSV